MKRFIKEIKNICEKNEKVAMFIDMDGTITEYQVYTEKTVVERLGEEYNKLEPVTYIINGLEDINNIPNIDLYILSLSKNNLITEAKKRWLQKNVPFIEEKNYIILDKENGEYNKENRDTIKSKKIKEILNNYDYVILLDDDHKILKEAKEMLEHKISVYHVSSAII